MNSRVRITIGSLLLVVGLHLNTLADETPNDQSDRAQRIELVQQFAARHRIATAAKPDTAFRLRPEAMLYFTNPARAELFGSIFVWEQNGRPMVFGGVFLWFEKTGTEMTREFHSLVGDPLMLHYDDKQLWAPECRGVEFKVIPESKPPAASRVARARQIKELASRFSATISNSDRPSVLLRQLARPIYRYPADSRVVDGAIVAFVQATDPEAMLLIEARKNADAVQWHYAFARCTSWEVTARLDHNVVYEAPFYDFSGTNDAASPFFISKRIRLGKPKDEAGPERRTGDPKSGPAEKSPNPE